MYLCIPQYWCQADWQGCCSAVAVLRAAVTYVIAIGICTHSFEHCNQHQCSVLIDKNRKDAKPQIHNIHTHTHAHTTYTTFTHTCNVHTHTHTYTHTYTHIHTHTHTYTHTYTHIHTHTHMLLSPHLND